MDNIKKTAIIGGAIIGGVIGGSISVIGHVVHNKFLDDLGGNIVDSTILTGQIAGEIASGATDIVVGKVKHKPRKIKRGRKNLINAGGRVVNNFVTNYKTITNNTGEIIEGIHMKDKGKVLKGVKTLGKMAAIGTITVGAIKLDQENEETDNYNNIQD
ncbi:MAG: hypothetical protein ACOX4P_03680 [Anaerovoracaceae bacterium]|jgi:hypothetical protein